MCAMEKTKIILMLLLLFGASTLYAQGKKNAKSDKKDNVVIVDDEACGCELVFIDGIQTIQRGDLFGFKREDGTIIVVPKYKFVDKFHDNYCLVYKDYNLCGLIDRDGREIVPPEYEEVNYPTDGMIRVRKNERYGFVDTTGALAIDCQYRTASGFSEGLAVALIDIDSNTMGYGFIDKNNKIQIAPKYEYAMAFQEGRAVVKLYDRFGMIDRDGNEVLPCKYLEVTNMYEGRFFAVDAKEGKAALFNNRYKRLTNFIYDKILLYQEDYYIVVRDGGYYFLARDGKEKFGRYEEASGFYDGYSMVKRDGKYGIINKRGKVILPIEYDNSGYRSMEYIFSENLAMIEKDGKYGFVNKQGKIVIPLIYNSAQHCTEGLIPVSKEYMWGFIDKEGNQVCDFVFTAASYFEWGRAEVVYNTEVFKINTEGQCVKNCKKYPDNIKFNFKH